MEELSPGHNPTITGGKGEPWLAREAITFLDGAIGRGWQGLEWGGGSSSPWFAQRLNRLVTIEHDARWAVKIVVNMAMFYPQLLPKWQLHLVPPAPEGRPAYRGADGKFHEAYAHAGRNYGPQQLVLVDGRARMACLKIAVQLLERLDHTGRPAGKLLVLDNSERAHYNLSIVPSRWHRRDFTTLAGCTTVWTM